MASTEKATQRAIIDYLTLKRYFFWRNNSGATSGEYNGKRYFFRFGTPGSPDIFVICDGEIIGIEVKDVKGRLSDTQEAFKMKFEENGGRYLVARSLDDVVEALE